jgi:hypothetical protein
MSTQPSPNKYFILRDRWVPQDFLPEEWWVFLAPSGKWFMSKTEPLDSGDRFWSHAGVLDCDLFAEAHNNATFIPPPVNKIQVRQENDLPKKRGATEQLG